jgi:hypothetical protein
MPRAVIAHHPYARLAKSQCPKVQVRGPRLKAHTDQIGVLLIEGTHVVDIKLEEVQCPDGEKA